MDERVRLFSNHPTSDVDYNSSTYHELKWMRNSQNDDDLGEYAELKCKISGAFSYRYFIVDDRSSKEMSV